MDNQGKLWLPLNSITEKIWYTDDESKNMRVIVSAPTEHPIVWTITKVENAKPIGIQKLTLYQNIFDPHKDYIEKDEDGKVIGMWADYFDNDIQPSDPSVLPNKPEKMKCVLSASTANIKIGGSYRLITAKYYDESGIDVTDKYMQSSVKWTCIIDGDDFTNQVKWLSQPELNKIKIKFPNDRKFLGKILTIRSEEMVEHITSEIELEITI